MTTDAFPLSRLLTGGALVLAGALLAFALLPGLVGAQATEEETPRTTEESAPSSETTPADGQQWNGRQGFGGRIGAHQALDVTAELTGTTTDDIIAALQDGASLASYAADQGVVREDLIAAIIAAMQQDLDDRVADGTLTRERADELTAEMDQKVETLVDREGFALRGGPGCGNQESGEETATDSI